MKNTWAELDLDVLRQNVLMLRKDLEEACKIIFIVKSDAYGHGVCRVAVCAWECGIRWFAVAHVEEAVILRGILPDAEIIMTGVIDRADVPVMIENNVIVFLVDKAHGEMVAAVSAKEGVDLRCHVKVDTGMGRLGFAWDNAAREIYDLSKLPGLNICGICTHFSSAGIKERSFTDVQAERFNEVVRECERRGLLIPFKHMANSVAMLRDSAWDGDGVRVGILLYGYGGKKTGDSLYERCIETKPFLHWKTRVIQVKNVPAGFTVSYNSTYVTKSETCIGIIDVGYADGYLRALSNKGFVLIGGKRCAVVGRVTMNVTVVDLGIGSDVKVGDEVVLMGTQGEESIWADEIAEWCDTICYEVLTGIKTEGSRPCGFIEPTYPE